MSNAQLVAAAAAEPLRPVHHNSLHANHAKAWTERHPVPHPVPPQAERHPVPLPERHPVPPQACTSKAMDSDRDHPPVPKAASQTMLSSEAATMSSRQPLPQPLVVGQVAAVAASALPAAETLARDAVAWAE